ncbi:patatin-like phospholipase family protein [Sorangium sp. So ce1097]|uniref:patatin-like phospholipase family protein n=1 Tax=Sorangium sp. So ce1097 TaxID=3133330 RepID=UPI003F641B5D
MSDLDDTAGALALSTRIPKPPIAIVLTGAGARGAYEAGFVSRLLPELKSTRPTIIVGTSAGAINAALLASLAARTPEEASREIVERWRHIHKEMVLGPAWRSLLRAGRQYITGLLFGRDAPTSLLDTRPLLTSLRDRSLLDWDVINDNLNDARIVDSSDCRSETTTGEQRADERDDKRERKVDVLAVATTESGSGRTKIFYQMRPKAQARSENPVKIPVDDDERAIDYVSTELSPEHVRASAAIPVLFPPTWLGSQHRGRYYVDGGLRLNAPLKPAIEFGANGIIVISTDSRRYGASAAVSTDRIPSIQDHILQAMRLITSDRMIEEVAALVQNNAVLRAFSENQLEPKVVRQEKPIPVVFGGPSGHNDVGSVAARALEDILRGTRKLGHLDLHLLYMLTSTSPYSRPDVLSYILFEPQFINAAIQAGIEDADELIENADELISGGSREAKIWSMLRRRHAEKMSQSQRCP